jgi:hypothetical protein
MVDMREFVDKPRQEQRLLLAITKSGLEGVEGSRTRSSKSRVPVDIRVSLVGINLLSRRAVRWQWVGVVWAGRKRVRRRESKIG